MSKFTEITDDNGYALCGYCQENHANGDVNAICNDVFICLRCADRIANAYHKARHGTFLDWPQDVSINSSYKKKTIPASLRTQVYERDLYRCVTCGTHLNLTCDHVIPESKGGPTTFENLQTMCRSCNSKKGDRS